MWRILVFVSKSPSQSIINRNWYFMEKSLSEKKKELEKLRKEVEDQESAEQHTNDQLDAKKRGLYIPKATATVKYNLYNRGERDFEEIGDNDWYTAGQLLGTADLQKNSSVALIDTGDGLFWFPVPDDGEYYGIEDSCVGMEDTAENRQYLVNIASL